jgi:hypothetical protein
MIPLAAALKRGSAVGTDMRTLIRLILVVVVVVAVGALALG